MVVVVQELRVEQRVAPERVGSQVGRVVELVVRPAPEVGSALTHGEHHVGVGVARGRHRHPLVGHPGKKGRSMRFLDTDSILSLQMNLDFIITAECLLFPVEVLIISRF